MHAILHESQSLLECSFSIIQIDAPLASALARLPALRSLIVEFSPQTTDYAPFLRPLVLPTLTDLGLRPLGASLLPQCPWSQPAYLGLHRLAILHYIIAPADLAAILHGMPSLTQFHLYLWAGSHTAPQAEWDAGVLRALLRALEELTFSTYPLAGVLEALEARVAAGRGGASVTCNTVYNG
jgi:hypothetical protein